MPFGREKCLALLARINLSLNTTAKQTIFTVPAGKTLVVSQVVARNVGAAAPTADAGFGGDANATDFRAAVQFDNLAAAGDGVIVTPDDGGASNPVPGKIKQYAAGIAFGMKVGTTAATTVDVDLFGYLF
jgi:hypothetical protein